MIISLLTDAPKHNLALMKISAWHKANGDSVSLNMINTNVNLTYGSWLFSQKYYADINGGSLFPDISLNPKFEIKPDYSLFPIDYSLGYTWRYCPRNCEFCVVPKQHNPKEHKSIWSFHDSKFKKICLLNNNTFSDLQWLETFQEIWDAHLIVVEHGFDLRLLNDEKAEALRKTKFEKGYVHFAFDRLQDEKQIRQGFKIARKYKIKAMVYVLVGFDTTREEDLHRCQIIHDAGYDPYVMPYNRGTKQDRVFKRFIDCRAYRQYKTLMEAWDNYKVAKDCSREIMELGL